VFDDISALAPVVTSFRINIGAASTANGLVTLNNTATNLPTHYMASEDAAFAGAAWQTYSVAPKFTLADGSGTRTVYLRSRTALGNRRGQVMTFWPLDLHRWSLRSRSATV